MNNEELHKDCEREVEKALQYSYRDCRNKKRDAGTRLHGVNYGNFMQGLMKENIQLNRKVLSELSMREPYSFKSLVMVQVPQVPGYGSSPSSPWLWFKSLVDISRNAFPGNKNIVFPPKKEAISIVV